MIHKCYIKKRTHQKEIRVPSLLLQSRSAVPTDLCHQSVLALAGDVDVLETEISPISTVGTLESTPVPRLASSRRNIFVLYQKDSPCVEALPYPRHTPLGLCHNSRIAEHLQKLPGRSHSLSRRL